MQSAPIIEPDMKKRRHQKQRLPRPGPRYPIPTFPFPSEGGYVFPKNEFDGIRADLDEQEFDWVPLYDAVAARLKHFRDDRTPLVNAISKMPSMNKALSYYDNLLDDGTREPMTDICPFTVFATFTLDVDTEKRLPLVMALCEFLRIKVGWPTDFNGVPAVQHRNPHFYAHEVSKRGDGDIEALWEVFSKSDAYAKKKSDETRNDFISAFDTARRVWGTRWNLTTGLFWSNSTCFLTLDAPSRDYIKKFLNLRLKTQGCTAEEYLELTDKLQAYFQDSKCPFNNFRELSRTARFVMTPDSA